MKTRIKGEKKVSYDYNKIREARLKQKITLFDLATKTGLSLMTIWNIERGIKEPKVSTILKITKALNIPIDSLFETVKEVSSSKAVEGDG